MAKRKVQIIQAPQPSVQVEGLPSLPVEAVSKPVEAPKPVKGAITRVESATAKERIFTVNGIKFFAAVGQSGHRMLTACDTSKKLLEGASRVLYIKGFDVTLKRDKKDKTLWLLSAREKVPSGPWPEEDAKPKAEAAP